MRASTKHSWIISWIFIILFIFTVLGRMIYGGVFWGRIRGYPGFKSSGIEELKKIEKSALLQWVLSLCFIPFGSFATSCQIIHRTTPSKCQTYEKKLVSLKNNDNSTYYSDLIKKLKKDYSGDVGEDELIQRYMDKNCKSPHIWFWVFQSIMIFIIVFEIISTMLICCFLK